MPAQLLTSPTVQKELKLTEDQTAKLKEWGAAQQGKMRELFQSAGGDRDAMREKMTEFQKQTAKELGEVLKPEQSKRLKEIEFQMAGIRGLMSPDTVKALELTDDQKEAVQSTMQDVGKDMRDLSEEYGVRGFGQRPADADKAKEFDKKSAQLTKDATAKVLKLMTPEQTKKYEAMGGEAIDVAKVREETARTGRGEAEGRLAFVRFFVARHLRGRGSLPLSPVASGRLPPPPEVAGHGRIRRPHFTFLH